MYISAFEVIVVFNRNVDQHGSKYTEHIPLQRLSVYVRPNVVCSFVLNGEIFLGHIIGDKEEVAFNMLASFYGTVQYSLSKQ